MKHSSQFTPTPYYLFPLGNKIELILDLVCAPFFVIPSLYSLNRTKTNQKGTFYAVLESNCSYFSSFFFSSSFFSSFPLFFLFSPLFGPKLAKAAAWKNCRAWRRLCAVALFHVFVSRLCNMQRRESLTYSYVPLDDGQTIVQRASRYTRSRAAKGKIATKCCPQ